jgi:serine/threonine protein kinase
VESDARRTALSIHTYVTDFLSSSLLQLNALNMALPGHGPEPFSSGGTPEKAGPSLNGRPAPTMDGDLPLIPSAIGNFKFQDVLGTGGYGVVWRATHNILNIDVAIKVVPKIRLDQDDSRAGFSREVGILQKMDHPFVPALIQTLEDDLNHYLVMEHLPHGSLLPAGVGRVMSESVARHYFVQLIVALDYLHNELHIAHRDLKAENVILDRYDNIRVIDFGLSSSFSLDRPMETPCGSPSYIPPEMIKEQKYTAAVDVWSAGVLLYRMTVGQLPFVEDDVGRLFQKIVFADPVLPQKLSPHLADLLHKMLTKDPEKRITLTKSKEHPWFSRVEYAALTRHCRQKTDAIVMAFVLKMLDLGMASPYLMFELFMGRCTDLTAVYRLLRRENCIETLRETISQSQKTASLDSFPVIADQPSHERPGRLSWPGDAPVLLD